MKILTISDVIVPFIYSPSVKERFGDVAMVIDCGDLPFYYLEFIVSILDRPLFFVRGNHAREIEQTLNGPRRSPEGAIDLHRRMYYQDGLILAGVEGSLRYHPGPFMYTQDEMWLNVFSLVPRLMINKIRYGRYLDLFITHASPWGIHDQPDLPHQGIKAFRWFISVFKPAYNFHGHIHTYRPDTVRETRFKSTRIINTFGYREIDVDLP